MSKDEERRRLEALDRAEYSCESCGWLGWSFTRAAQLQLRETGPGKPPIVLCVGCAEKHDAREARRRAS